LKDDGPTLKRETAGRYGSTDGRFTVEAEGANAWYMADEEQVDQLGQPVLRGPFPTLAAARIAVAEARSTPVSGRDLPKAMQPPQAHGRSAGQKRGERPAGRAPRPRRSVHAADREAEMPPWLAELAPNQRAAAQRLADELKGLGIDEPETLVADDLLSDEPLIAQAILLRRLRERLHSGQDAEAVLDVLRDEGFRPGAGRPPFGWRLVEVDRQGKPTERRLRVRRS
jgi:hypothetical protein